jgi:ribosomal protein S18 acetylase RimI-like enzyme
MELIVKPLTPELADDFLEFFDDTAFSDNPEWAGCYCCFYHIPSPEWERRTSAQNREYARKAINEGRLNGYLAYSGNDVVGWVNAGPRKGYARLGKENEPDNACSVVCFTIAPAFRGRGIATRLLQAVIDGANGRYDYVEAYPLKGEQTCAYHYHGPLAMYEKAGFEIAEERKEHWVVRRKV